MATHEVWKYQFPDDRIQYEHWIPNDAQVVHYAVQNDVPTVWYEVDPDKVSTVHTFHAIMTGEPFEVDEWARSQRRHVHVATFMIDWLVVHIYDMTE